MVNSINNTDLSCFIYHSCVDKNLQVVEKVLEKIKMYVAFMDLEKGIS